MCCCCCRFCCGAPATDIRIHAPVLHDALQIYYCRYWTRALLPPITSSTTVRIVFLWTPRDLPLRPLCSVFHVATRTSGPPTTTADGQTVGMSSSATLPRRAWGAGVPDGLVSYPHAYQVNFGGSTLTECTYSWGLRRTRISCTKKWLAESARAWVRYMRWKSTSSGNTEPYAR